MDFLRKMPPHATGTYHGLMIHRHCEPRDWREALAQIPEQFRSDAEAYLRDVAACMRAKRAITPTPQRNRAV